MTEYNFYLLILSFSSSVYFLTNQLKPEYYWETEIDRKIKPNSAFIAPYIFFFPFLGLSALTFYYQPIEFFKEFTVSISLALAIGGIIWFFFPNGVKRPKEEMSEILKRPLNWIWWIDKNDTNGCPSGHVFGALICGYYLILLLPQYSLLIFTTACLITLATIFTKQHYLIDVLGGICISIISVTLSKFLIG